MTKNCILKSNPKFQKIAAIYTVPIAEILVHKYNETISGEELFYPEVKTLNTWITQSKTEQIKNLREILDSETGLTTKALVSLLQGIVSKYEGVYMVTRGNLHGGGLVNRAFHEEFTFGTNLRLMQELERDYPQHFEVVSVPKNKYSYIVKINPARLSKPTVEQLKLFNVENSNQLGVTSKQHLEQLFENNTELTAKAVLNNIKKAQPHLKNLVNKLESLVSENTIVSLDESTGYSTPFGTANAYFNKVNGNIGIAKNALFSKTPEAVILHEILHAVSHDKLKIDDNANYQFNLLLEYVTDELGLENFEYALQNRDEFLAAVLTDPAFAEALSSIKAIDSKNQNIFEQIINYILKLINTTKIDNAYDQAVSLINEILELQSDNTVSPGVSEVFKMAPELANIGTPEQYSQYLNTIFPNSLIKDIVFHGTGYGEKITSLRNRSYFSTLDTASEYAAWDESNRIEYAFSQGLPESEIKAKAQLVPALINLVNPKRLDGVNYKDTEKDYPGHDGIYSENTVDPLTGNELQIVVFDSKNTHVLGSKQDMQKFKDFVNSVNFELKSVNILSSDKAKQVFDKGQKNKWSLDKILTELQVPKEQKQLILNLGKTNREEIITDLLANYSYTIEINTATEPSTNQGITQSDRLGVDNIRYIQLTNEQGEVEYRKMDIVLKKSVLITKKEFEKALAVPTQYYSNLTVPGGTNYTENEIATPAITPSIKGHAQFATDKGIGWFRSDDKIANIKTGKKFDKSQVSQYMIGQIEDWLNEGVSDEEIQSRLFQEIPEIESYDITKTRRILEVQSDLFQKGRDKEDLITRATLYDITDKQITHNGITYRLLFNIDNAGFHVVEKGVNKAIPKSKLPQEVIDWATNIRKSITTTSNVERSSNQFLQLLNKNNNWVTFFVKSIIQDSAKKRYEKVLFPTGNTASKVEGHATLEEFKKQKEDRIKELQEENDFINEKGKDASELEEQVFNDNVYEIKTLKQELERVETEGFAALRPIYNFYENVVTNILKKQGYNPVLITDEYGNTWNELTIDQARDLDKILYNVDKPVATKTKQDVEETILSNPDTIYVLEADEQGNIYTTETGVVKLDNYSNVHLITTAVDFNSDKSFTPEESKRIKDRLESDLDILEQISTDDSSVSVMDNNLGTHLAGKDSNLKNFLDVRLSNQLGLKRESSTDSQLVEAEESVLTIENIDSENLQDEELLQKSDPKKQEEAKSIQFVTEIVDRLIANLGMPEGSVNFITAQEAKELTANAKNPYNGEPAFFYKGKVYFVDGQFNFSTAVHEISHPFIKSIRYQNPQLFNKLFDDLYATETGKLVAQESTEDYYDNFNEEVPEKELNDDIKEETIVRFFSEILEAVLNDQDAQIGSSPKEQSAIAKIIMDILYALKKLFRQVVGKGSKIEKLKADTTLKELANLLATEQFQVDMDIVSQEDIVDYINNQKKLNKELRDVLTNSPGRSEIFKAVNETSVMYRKLLDELRKNGDIFMLNAVLEENWDGSTLVTDLAKAAGEVKYENVLKKLAREENALEEIAIVGNNIVRILAGQEKILENVKNRLDYLSKQSLKNDKLVVNELNTYRNHLKNVLEFTESFSKIAEEIEIDEQDEIFKEIRALESKAKRRLKDINKIHEKIILPVLKSVWDSYMGATTIQLKSQKEKLEKALQEEGAYKAGIQRSLNNINDQLSKIDLGLEAFKEHAFGKRGDINPLSSWFESYIAQQDPTIASFAAYVKGELSDAQNEEYARFNTLRNKLKALEKELGISPSDINKYAEEFLTADVVKISNDQDELIDFEVYALLNPFKNTENTLRGMYVNIENLRDKVEEGEPGALEELEKAEAKLKLHKALFYNNEMIDEYYFVDNTLLTNPDVDGASLLAKVNEKQTEMKALHSQRMVTNDALELKVLQDEIKQKRFEIKELYSDYSNGVKKTAQELKDAKALREWREAKSKYYDFALKKGDFEKALSGYEQTVIATLENQNLDQETINEILAEKRKEWISQNTRVVIKQEFYEKKARYLETLNSINEQIEESLQKDKTISDMVGSSVYYNNKLYKVSYKNGEYLFTRENEDPISFDVDATTLINSLGAQVPTRKIFDLNREYIFQSLLGKKDENGEYMVTELSEEHLAAIKEMQEEIEKDKEFLINNNGLTSAEMRELSGYFEIKQRGEQLASKDFNRYKELLDKKNKFKIDPALKRQLLVYSRLLNELQTKEASSYYIDYLNDNFYDLFLSQDLVEQGEIRLDNIESILNIEVANALMEASPEFKEWFEKNHYIAEVYVEDGIYEEMYQRIEPWNKIVPTDPADYESFQITRQDGSEETIPGLPTTDYYQRELKNEYKLGYNPQTGLVENSQYKDISNRFTPKNLEQMQEMVKKYPEYFANSEYTWDHYINKKYYDVMEAGGPKAEILKSILEYHQESQKGLDDNQMLGYYLPRFRADLYENLTSDDRESIGDRLSEFWEKTASQFMVRKDDYQESSFNFAETVYAADKIVYRTDSEKIPIQGKYLLEKKQVSRDVFHVLGAYALSAAENKRLKKSNHMARFLQTVAAENKPYDKIQTNSIKDQAKQKIKNNKMLLSGRDNFRSATIDAMVESIYEGKQIATDSPLYTSIAKFTQPLTSIGVFSFFAFDLHSAFKNYLGARSMVALESINSRFFSYKSHLMATPWAHKVMFNISNEIYTKGANSLEVQMMMAFDAFQGRFKQKFATSPGRKFARDLVNFTWTSNTRQYLEIATNVETFAAILHHIKLEQETPEGKKTIRYVDAWELNPETKTLQLKPGIDKKYDIDGEEFIKVKAAAQEHNNFAQGVYAQFDSTRIERTVYGSMSMRMKKFFIKMAINRFSGAFDGDRTNLATGRVESGFYVKAVKTLKRLIQSGGKDFNYLQADEKKAMIQTLVDLLKGYILYEVILLGMMLGFDFDDEDRFSKMRERSGALPTPFTDPSHSKDWNFTGWFNNNLALLLLNTHEEVTFFHTPKSVIGTAKEWSPVTEGSAAEAVISIGKDLVDGLNPWSSMDVYSRTVGGLNVQQKNEYKIWMKIYKLIGLKGKAIDPVTQMKNKSTMRRLKTGAKKQEEEENED